MCPISAAAQEIKWLFIPRLSQKVVVRFALSEIYFNVVEVTIIESYDPKKTSLESSRSFNHLLPIFLRISM